MIDRFETAVTELYQSVGSGVAELLPMVLSEACVRAIPVAGAGISITDQIRIPLGASDHVVARAERLQTTLGEGPCLTATQRAEPQFFDSRLMAASWPVFHTELTAQTPFRTVASFPLQSFGTRSFGALDLYSTDTQFFPLLALVDDIQEGVVTPMNTALFNTPMSTTQTAGVEVPQWMKSDSATRRMNVWLAIGILVEYDAHLSNADALAVLRAYYYTRDLTLDDTADQLASRRLLPEAVLGHADADED